MDGRRNEFRFFFSDARRDRHIGIGLIDFDGYVIPLASIRQDMNGNKSVFVFDKESSTLKQISIVTGGVLNNEIAVMSGLRDDDIIATAGVSFLSDGQTVHLLE